MAFKVEKKYRTNPLSHKKGPWSVFCKKENGRIQEYDDVHQPFGPKGYMQQCKEDPTVIKYWLKKNY